MCFMLRKMEGSGSVRSYTSGPSRQLACPEFDFWLHAIVTDNQAEVERRLASVTSHERYLLLNGRFHVPSAGLTGSLQPHLERIWGQVMITRPWCLAAVCNAHRVLTSFLRYGVRVCQKEQGGYNLFHCLIYFAFLNQPLEGDMRDTFVFVKRLLMSRNPGMLRRLLHMENSQGLRPLEMAAHLNTSSLFLAIFETEGVYLMNQESLGLYSLQWFDVTVYECVSAGNRRRASPTYLLAYLDETRLKDSSTKHLYSSDLLQSWLTAKLQINRQLLYFWFTLRLLFFLLYISLQVNGHLYPVRPCTTATFTEKATNSTSSVTQKIGPPSIAVFSLFLYCAICLAFDWCEAFLWLTRKGYRWTRFTPKGPKSLLLSDTSFRVAQFLSVLSFTVLTVNTLQFHYGHDGLLLSKAPLQVWNILALFSSTWSLMYFLQLIPWLSLIIASFQRVIADVLKVLALYIILVIIYFKSLIRQADCNLIYDNQSIQVSFGNVAQSALLTLLKHPETLAVTHATVFVLSLMVLGATLTTMFSREYRQLDEHVASVQAVQRLSVIHTLERRTCRLVVGRTTAAQKLFFICRHSRIYTPRLVLKRRLRPSRPSYVDYDKPNVRISRYENNVNARPNRVNFR